MFRVRMIKIFDNPISERYARYTAPTWSDFDFEFYRAVTPDTLHLQRGELKFTNKRNGTPHTETEMATWYSHFNLWKECASSGVPYLILEHDAYLHDRSVIKYDPSLLAVYYGQHAMEAVMYSPKLCAYLVETLLKSEITKGPMSFLDSVLGIFSSPQSRFALPHARYIGKLAPVKSVIDPSIGTTIEHTGTGSSVTYRVTLGDDKDLFLVKDLSDV